LSKQIAFTSESTFDQFVKQRKREKKSEIEIEQRKETKTNEKEKKHLTKVSLSPIRTVYKLW
jgi:hypothetical protein